MNGQIHIFFQGILKFDFLFLWESHFDETLTEVSGRRHGQGHEEAAGGRGERPEFNQPTGGESGKKFAIPLALPVDRVGKGPI